MRFFNGRKQAGWTALKKGQDDLTLAHVERRFGQKPQVTAWLRQKLDPQSAADVKSFSEAHDLKPRHCVALLGRAEYQLMQVDAVKVPPSEVRQAIRWSLRDRLEYPAANATVDVLDIPADDSNPSRPRYMMAVAARNETIREYVVRYLDEGKMGLEAIDIPEIGQRNIAALLEQPNRGMALLSFNQDGGLLTFTSGGELYHARQIDVPVEQLQLPDEDRRAQVYERVALDLQRSLDNFERQFPYLAVNRMLVAPFAMRPGFVDFLKSYLYLQVETFDLADILDISAVPELSDPDEQARALYILGAALREDAA